MHDLMTLRTHCNDMSAFKTLQNYRILRLFSNINYQASINDCRNDYFDYRLYKKFFTCSIPSYQISGEEVKNTKNPEKKPAKTIVDATGKLVKKKYFSGSKVKLIDSNNEEHFLYLEQAQKLASSANKKLVKVEEKGDKTVYKFDNSSKFDSKKPDQLKKIKILEINSEISQHDFQVKINHIIYLISKGKNIKVIFGGRDLNKAISLSDLLEKTIGRQITEKKKKLPIIVQIFSDSELIERVKSMSEKIVKSE